MRVNTASLRTRPVMVQAGTAIYIRMVLNGYLWTDALLIHDLFRDLT